MLVLYNTDTLRSIPALYVLLNILMPTLNLLMPLFQSLKATFSTSWCHIINFSGMSIMWIVFDSWFGKTHTSTSSSRDWPITVPVFASPINTSPDDNIAWQFRILWCYHKRHPLIFLRIFHALSLFQGPCKSGWHEWHATRQFQPTELPIYAVHLWTLTFKKNLNPFFPTVRPSFETHCDGPVFSTKNSQYSCKEYNKNAENKDRNSQGRRTQ